MKKVYINKSNISIKNREINYKYDIIEKIECGIELKGTEVKSIRDGMCNLKDCFALIKDGEIIYGFLYHYRFGLGYTGVREKGIWSLCDAHPCDHRGYGLL